MDRAERFRLARKDPALAVLEGFHALKHALRFGAEILEAAASREAPLDDLVATLAPELAGRLDPDVVAPEAFAALAPVPHPTGVIAIARRPDQPDALDGEEAVVLLEEPRRLENVGAVVRVAAAAGASGVLTTGEADPWHPAALRAAAGLHYALPVRRVEALGRSGRPLVAVDPAGEELRRGVLPARPILAFGTERAGLGPELLARADLRVRIPMRPGVSSLNLATAVAVVLYAQR